MRGNLVVDKFSGVGNYYASGTNFTSYLGDENVIRERRFPAL